MDDYRSGASRRLPSSASRRLTASLPSDRTVLILGPDVSSITGMVHRFRNSSWRVAFLCPGMAESRELAQSSGAQHHPAEVVTALSVDRAISYITAHWGRLDLAVICLSSHENAAIRECISSRGIAFVHSFSGCSGSPEALR